MKHTIKTKIICVILSMIILAQAAPVTIFAIETENISSLNTTNVTSESNNTSLDISCEVVDNRTEYSKVFLLSDNTFYNLNTTYPLHRWENNAWVDIYDGFNSVDTVDDVKDIVNEIEVVSNNSVETTASTNNSSNTATIEALYNSDMRWSSEYEAYEIKATDGALRITPNNVSPYTARNRAINSAFLNFSRDDIDNPPAESLVTIYEGVENVTLQNINGLDIVDERTITDIDDYCFDITNLYAKWDIGATAQYGVVLRARGNDFFTIRNAYFEVFYEEIDWNDPDYTYRTIDLGDGGTLSINDYTNTVLLENKLFKLDSSILPIYVSRVNDGANPNTTSSAGFGFSWNIESAISVSNNLCTWTTIDLEKKYFVPDENVLIENGYQIWKENNSNGIEDQTSIYFYVPHDDVINNTIDYSEVYIKQGDTKYSFDNQGRLASVERPGAENKMLSVIITYDAKNNLNSIVTEKGRTYVFEYSENSTLRRDYLWRLLIDGSYSMLFGTEPHIDETIQEYNPDYVYDNYRHMDDGETIENSDVYFTVDKMGNIVRILDIYDNYWKFNYVNYGDRERNLGNRLTSYEVHSRIDGTENQFYRNYEVNLNMVNGNYREIIKTDLTTEEESVEIIQYDSKHRIVTHKQPDGYCVCVDYDDNGIINSFAFNENATNMMSNPSFETGADSSEYNWSYSEHAEIVPSSYKNGEHGTNELRFNIVEPSNVSVSQTVTGNFLADNTYVVGAWIKVDQTIPNENKKIGIQVNDISNGTTEVTFGTVDNGLDGEWQYRLQAFKPSLNTSNLQINLTALEQTGDIRFDELTLFKAEESQVDIKGVDVSSSIAYSYDENNRLESETITNGVHSIRELYEYNDDGSLYKVNNINGKNMYYQETSSSIKTIGTSVDDDGNIVDATSFEYNALDMLSKVSQTVNGLSGISGSNATMTTEYDWQGDNISSVTHNGMTYNFEYDSEGSVEQISVSSSNANQTLIEKELIFGEDNPDYIILYANDYAIEYLHNEDTGLVEYIDYYCPADAFEPNYTYSYTYDENTGSLDSISLLVSEEEVYSVNYLENGYQAINIFENELYIKGENENGEKVETINQAYFTGNNNTSADSIVTSNTNISETNSSDGSTTISSSVVINKNASDNKHSQMTYERSSVIDYFDRLSGKKTTLTYETGNQNNTVYYVESDTNYEYKMLDVGVSSGLVHNYNTTISGNNGIANAQMTEYASYSRNYEYDDRENIKYVYILNGSTETPCEYYEYDEANQLVTAINFYTGSVIKYIYDIDGNVTSKNNYNYNELVFDYENRSVLSLGEVISTDSYTYDNVYKDRLIAYNGLSLNCDSLGNPRNYTGRDIDNSIITGNLEWNGYNLTAFDNDDMRIEYQYNQSGDRTMKTVYDKSDNRLIYRMSYIWDDGVLSTLIYQGGDSEEVNLNIIYDQEGAPVGYITSMGLPYYFLKDYNENVVGFVHADGTLMCSITYDTWGIPTYTYHGNNLLEKLVIKATAIFNPVTYHGFIYDYETGMYCSRGRCYSPEWGRYINSDTPTSLMNVTDYIVDVDDVDDNPLALFDVTGSVLDSNLYLFCNNNPINNVDVCSMWSRDCYVYGKNSRGFKVEMSDLFASRALCTIFANQILEQHGEWSASIGYHYRNMSSLRVASTLFAHYVAKNAPSAINKVNATWGDAWVNDCQQITEIIVNRADTNAWKYEKIWYAAEKIKEYAWDEGVYITI